MLQLVDYNFN